MEKLKIPYPILVEGKYDRLRLSLVCDAKILCTEGFGIFKKSETLALLRRLAVQTPIILLTDSDGAGKLIRSYVTRAIPRDRLIQLYIPQIVGKEKRKTSPSAEGTLGVEGMETELLRQILAPYENPDAVARAAENPLSKTDLFIDGLTGGKNSAAARDAFCDRVGLPHGMTPNAFLAALRMLCTYEEYLALAERNTPHT